MPEILTTASTVACGHTPGEVSTASAAKLTVNGNPVLLQDSIVGKSVSGCSSPNSSGSKTCTSVTGVLSGLATKLTVGGAPVMLSTLSGTTDGLPTAPMSATAAQTKLTST